MILCLALNEVLVHWFWRWRNASILALIRWGRKHDGILWSICGYQSCFDSWCYGFLCWEWLWNRMGNSHNFRCIMSNIMTTITTNIGNGFDKVVNDVTTLAEAALPVLAQFSFEYALHVAFTALLSWLSFFVAGVKWLNHSWFPLADGLVDSNVTKVPHAPRLAMLGLTKNIIFLCQNIIIL